MPPKEIAVPVHNGARTVGIKSKYLLGMNCGVSGHVHHEPCQNCVESMPKKEQEDYPEANSVRNFEDVDAVDDLDAATFYLERFGDRMQSYATVLGYKSRSEDSQQSKDAKMAQAQRDLDKYRRRAADQERLMDEYKKKYVLDLG